MTSLETRIRRVALGVALRAISPGIPEDLRAALQSAASLLDACAEEARRLEATSPVAPHWLPQAAPDPDDLAGRVVVDLAAIRARRAQQEAPL